MCSVCAEWARGEASADAEEGAKIEESPGVKDKRAAPEDSLIGEKRRRLKILLKCEKEDKKKRATEKKCANDKYIWSV